MGLLEQSLSRQDSCSLVQRHRDPAGKGVTRVKGVYDQLDNGHRLAGIWELDAKWRMSRRVLWSKMEKH